VRAYMQAGEYRRALAFGAHTAGAHREETTGMALYAWLLYCGGQRAVAFHMLDERDTGDPLLASVRAQLASANPLAEGPLLQAPTRFGPYGSYQDLPFTARVAGSGVLIDGGRRAIVPIHTLKQSPAIWVRNGLGQLAPASVERWLIPSGVALLRLKSALPADPDFAVADHDPFPGSVAIAIEFAVAPKALPGWPVLRTGFMGAVMTHGNLRTLGIEMPKGPRGGPVFDVAGRLVGIAIPGVDRPDQLVPVSDLRKSLGTLLGSPMPASLGTRIPLDQVYESALRTTIQVIASR
jgi:hypothetical protein